MPREPITPQLLERLRLPDPTVGTSPLPVLLRRKHTHDVARVARDWLKSLRGAPQYANITNEVYYFWQHSLVEGAWVDPTCGWIVACNPADPDQIYGWLCGQRAQTLSGDMALLHYVYVAKPYRRVGLCSRLLLAFDGRIRDAGATVVTTAQTPAWKVVAERLGVAYLYNPYLLWGRAAVPRPDLKYRSVKRRMDPLKRARKELVRGGYVPGAGVEEGAEEE